MTNQPIKKEANEQDWLNSIRQVFTWAKKQKPPQIAQSEIESLLLGLRGQETNPLYPKQLTPAGKKAEQMLQGYLDVMKTKKKRFLPIK